MLIQWYGPRWLGPSLGPSTVIVWRTYGSGNAPPIVSATDEVNERLTISSINTGGTKMVYGGAGGIM